MLMSLNLRWKIMLALVGLSIVPLLLVQFLASRLVDDIATDDLGQLALRTTSYLQRSITRNQQELLDKGIQAARSADLANAVHFAGLTGETGQLEGLLENLQQHGHLDLAEVHDDNGRVLVRKLAAGQSLPPTDNSALPVLKKALAGKAVSSINNYDDHVALIAAIPVQLQEQHLGQLVLVNFIDNEFAVESAHISEAEVAFFNATGVFASSHRELDGVDLWRVMDQNLSEVPLENKPYSLFYSEMGQTGLSMLVALDRSGAKAAILSMRNLLWSTVAGAGLIAILLGMFFSRGIVHPLNAIVASLQEIAEGEADLTRELPVTSRDEVGLLAASFNRFISRLREMVSRTGNVAIDLVSAGEKIRLSSREVNQGASSQSVSMEESHQALIAIDTSSNEVAESIGSLVSAVEESSSATLELGATIEQISAQMEKLFSTVDEVSSSISEMSVSSQQVAENVDILNSSTEVTASSIIELDASIKEIEENAEQTGKLAEAAAHDAESGKQAVEATISGIGAIQQTVDSAGVTIRELGNQSNAIGKILTVIDDVADQTSLLALNAAIIAAQAGDHGRGFAVVADEIRELADRTAVSTREIGQIIARVQSGTQDAVEAMEAGAERVHQEMARSEEAGRALEQIRNSTLKANKQVRSIVRATQEQSRGSRQITDSINQVSSMLSQIAGAVRQQNESTRQLARAAEAMKEIASHGKLGTAEHAKGSRQINISMEQIRQMTERIDGATQAQAERSREVVKAIASLKEIAENNALRTAELDSVVDDLTGQTAALEDEVGAFKV